MIKYIRAAMFAAALSASLVPASIGQTMNQKLSKSAAVPLDFLAWIDRDADWLREGLAKLGIKSGFTILDMRLEATTIEALRGINRIRSFAYLSAPGLRPPYFDLSVSNSDGSLVGCVTLFPRSIAPDIGALDFDRESFPISKADPKILDFCRVHPRKGADFLRLDRVAFRTMFFDAAGDLKIEFINLNSDAAFIAQAIKHGFFVFQQDLTGRLRLGQE